MTAAARPNWYVAQTHPNSEGKAAIQLERQGFETYLPRYIKTARHARRTRLLQAPLFPRYIFVRLDPQTQRWRAVNSTTGITRLVGHGDWPSPVVAGIIEGLKQREGANGFFDLKAPALSFKAGDAVRVVRGVFEACQGFFEARTDQDRVAILLDLLGRKARVVLDARAVEAV
jgi:transcriptional antiterminator RfaH